MKKTSNIIFFGTPPFAVKTVEAIVQSGRNVPLVITQPDRPSGRGLKAQPSAVKEWALSRRQKYIQPLKMKDPAFHEQLKATESKYFVVAAYGRILPKAILDIPELTINVHASLLPRWRGAAPIQRAILSGDQRTGVSIMRLVQEMDAGDYCLQKELKIGEDETRGELEDRLANLGAKALVEALDQIDQGTEKFKKQDSFQVTFAPPITTDETKINWGKTSEVIHNQVRAFQPNPGSYTTDGLTRLKIHRTRQSDISEALLSSGTLLIRDKRLWVACADRWIEILEVQKEGRSRQPIKIFLPGYRVTNPHRWS